MLHKEATTDGLEVRSILLIFSWKCNTTWSIFIGRKSITESWFWHQCTSQEEASALASSLHQKHFFTKNKTLLSKNKGLFSWTSIACEKNYFFNINNDIRFRINLLPPIFNVLKIDLKSEPVFGFGRCENVPSGQKL